MTERKKSIPEFESSKSTEKSIEIPRARCNYYMNWYERTSKAVIISVLQGINPKSLQILTGQLTILSEIIHDLGLDRRKELIDKRVVRMAQAIVANRGVREGENQKFTSNLLRGESPIADVAE